MNLKIIVAEDELITRMDMIEIIEEAGYSVVGQAGDGFEAIEVCRRERPDLAIMDIKMPLLDGIKAAKIIKEENLAKCVILVTAYSDLELINEAKGVGVMSYLVKPIDEKSLIPAIEIAFNKQSEINNVKSELEIIQQKLEDRKIIEKAKGIIMTKRNYSEDESYKFIRSLAMEKRTSIRKISEVIVKSFGE